MRGSATACSPWTSSWGRLSPGLSPGSGRTSLPGRVRICSSGRNIAGSQGREGTISPDEERTSPSGRRSTNSSGREEQILQVGKENVAR